MSALLLFAITWAGLPPEQALERALGLITRDQPKADASEAIGPIRESCQ